MYTLNRSNSSATRVISFFIYVFFPFFFNRYHQVGILCGGDKCDVVKLTGEEITCISAIGIAFESGGCGCAYACVGCLRVCMCIVCLMIIMRAIIKAI